jgi:hypothetical protein
MPQMKTLTVTLALSIVCLGAATSCYAQATLFTDRAAFSAASVNPATMPFDDLNDQGATGSINIGGVKFSGPGWIGVNQVNGRSGKVLVVQGPGESIYLQISFPTPVTAIGLDLSTLTNSRPLVGTIRLSTGESFPITAQQSFDFFGVVSDAPITSLSINLGNGGTLFVDPIAIDNLTFGQKAMPGSLTLVSEAGTRRAIALDLATHMRGPFTTPKQYFFGAPQEVRILLFARGVPAHTVVTAEAIDAAHKRYHLPVAQAVPVAGVSGLLQLVVHLPYQVHGVGDVDIEIKAGGLVSNKAQISIR